MMMMMLGFNIIFLGFSFLDLFEVFYEDMNMIDEYGEEEDGEDEEKEKKLHVGGTS
jgi:hypothetical protein